MVVTARRVEEAAQEVPIPVSVVRGDLVADAGAFNVNRLKEMLPTVQFYSTNPRNSSINIRGLGSPFGLTNDGIEPGVGLYIDGVFYARPASATLDFLDVDQVEVLRGPQGTLFGKNTTAGAINVTNGTLNASGSNSVLGTGAVSVTAGDVKVTCPFGKAMRAALRAASRAARSTACGEAVGPRMWRIWSRVTARMRRDAHHAAVPPIAAIRSSSASGRRPATRTSSHSAR